MASAARHIDLGFTRNGQFGVLAVEFDRLDGILGCNHLGEQVGSVERGRVIIVPPLFGQVPPLRVHVVAAFLIVGIALEQAVTAGGGLHGFIVLPIGLGFAEDADIRIIFLDEGCEVVEIVGLVGPHAVLDVV